MQLSSPTFAHEASIPKKYTCQGLNINPPLVISKVPSQAKSLVLIMDDPDVPKSVRADQMWVHWILYNIDPKITMIQEGSSPVATHGKNTGEQMSYMGPCPPDREHRYFFKLYALDTMLSVAAGATKEEIEQAMQGHIIEQTILMGRYVKE